LSHEKLRVTLKPVAMTMQFGLCLFFLFLALSLSIEWQVKRIFIPLYLKKIQLNVTVNSECGNKLMNQENYLIPSDCLKCESKTDAIKIKQCDFATVGTTKLDVAKTLVKENGLIFSTHGYIDKEKVYLRHNPMTLLKIHIPIWIFGLLPFFLFAYKKPTHS
jgi:hypothetical protein